MEHIQRQQQQQLAETTEHSRTDDSGKKPDKVSVTHQVQFATDTAAAASSQHGVGSRAHLRGGGSWAGAKKHLRGQDANRVEQQNKLKLDAHKLTSRHIP